MYADVGSTWATRRITACWHYRRSEGNIPDASLGPLNECQDCGWDLICLFLISLWLTRSQLVVVLPLNQLLTHWSHVAVLPAVCMLSLQKGVSVDFCGLQTRQAHPPPPCWDGGFPQVSRSKLSSPVSPLHLLSPICPWASGSGGVVVVLMQDLIDLFAAAFICSVSGSWRAVKWKFALDFQHDCLGTGVEELPVCSTYIFFHTLKVDRYTLRMAISKWGMTPGTPPIMPERLWYCREILLRFHLFCCCCKETWWLKSDSYG